MQKRKTNFFIRLMNKLDLSARVCNHLVGENHTHKHRVCFGIIVALTGVCIAKASTLVHFMPFHIIIDGIGYFLHAVGVIPLITAVDKYKSIDDEIEL